ncbi:MAG: glycogen debranching protein GlgX [Alphaproteobacteria bacterium]|nr:glycogen debranching protein GlgX [Alphaproteobacteria bacterium]
MGHAPDRLDVGKPYPVGATWDGLGVNFAVFSAHAERIDLCIFDKGGKREIARFPLPEYTNEIWHGYLPHASPGTTYGLRAFGPYNPAQGHRFNPSKLLLDPYAKALCGQIHWTDALFGYRLHSARTDLTIDRRDSAHAMPKCVVVDDQFSWGPDCCPEIPWSQTILYEMHVRGFTKLFADIQPPERGTFAALCHPKVIAHLKRIGITTIELMPIHAFLQDRLLLEKGLSNYWGYNTLGFFAPEPLFLGNGPIRQVREMVRRMHAERIEIILDVVYNHTCEGSELGPTLCWRGLDNASYYRLAENPRHTINDTGTGNTLNLTHPRVLQMVMDSLRYWAQSFHVDGFRFDLGLTLGREQSGFDRNAGFFHAILQDPILSRLKLITEPWDVGPGGYQLGGFPPGFAEWNDRCRDGLRKYWRGDPGMRPELAARMSGSGDIFDTRKRRPWSSVNYLASHDGMTLQDVVSYTAKHNEANGESDRDGHSENCSSNYGAEGATDNRAIVEYRERVKRSMLTSLLGAMGTPMLLMGDECGRTQSGNNNAYCQDNEISWFDWSLIECQDGNRLVEFVAQLIRARQAFVTLRSNRYLGSRELVPGLTEMSWWDERGVELSPEDWKSAEGRLLVLRRALRRVDGSIEVTALMMNADTRGHDFKLPGQFPWQVILDSARLDAAPLDSPDATYPVGERTAVLLAAVVGPDHGV